MRALGDCDAAHLKLLQSFVRTANELGLGDGSPDFDKVIGGLNSKQLEIALPELVPLVDSLLSTLERHGTIRGTTAASGLASSIGPTNVMWQVTDFGRQFLDRLALVYESLSAAAKGI